MRAIRLNVAGAFHSPLMEPAVAPIVEELRRVRILRSTVPDRRERHRARSCAIPTSCGRSWVATWSRPCGGKPARRHSRPPVPRRSWRPAPATSSRRWPSASCPTPPPSRSAPRRCAAALRGRLRGSDILDAVTRFATIAGVGSYLPATARSQQVVRDDRRHERRLDPRPHRHREPGTSPTMAQQTSELASHASHNALAAAGISPEQLDMIVCATITGDTVFPATAVWLQQKLGISCPAFDVNAACAGFSYGMSTATAFVTSGMADTILVIGAEIFSRIIDFTDRGTCILFGDGAGAAVLSASDAPGVEGSVLGADGSAAEILWMPAGGTRAPASHATVDARDHFVQMPNGREVFKRAVTEMAASCRELLEKSGYGVEDVDVLIPHQANARILAAVVDRLGHRSGAGGRRRRRGRQHVRRIDPDRARPRVARRPDPSGRPGAVHVLRRGPHLGRHARALDDAGAVVMKVAVVTGASRGHRPRVRGGAGGGRLDGGGGLPQRRGRREGGRRGAARARARRAWPSTSTRRTRPASRRRSAGSPRRRAATSPAWSTTRGSVRTACS